MPAYVYQVGVRQRINITVRKRHFAIQLAADILQCHRICVDVVKRLQLTRNGIPNRIYKSVIINFILRCYAVIKLIRRRVGVRPKLQKPVVLAL